jgi:hypothetical protein
LEFPGDSGIWRETLFANSWYVNPVSVVNRYQLLGFVGFNGALCMGYSGETCPELAQSLFEVRTATGLTLADELAISSAQIVKTPSTEQYLDNPPRGWHVADDGALTQTWVRDEVIAGAGGIVASSGLNVSDVRRSPENVTFRVDDAPTGGTVTFSRLAWPGYEVSGAELAPPADGFLLTIDVPPGASGDITVSFRPAGIGISVGALMASLAIAAVWTITAALRRRSKANRHVPLIDGAPRRR